TGLTTGAAAENFNRHVIGIAQVECAEWRIHYGHQRFAFAEVSLGTFTVDGDAAITIGEEAHAGYSRLTPSHAVVILTFDGIRQDSFSSSLLFLSSRRGLLWLC